LGFFEKGYIFEKIIQDGNKKHKLLVK